MTSESSRKWDSEEKKLELRLGPPGEEDWFIKKDNSTANTSQRDGSSSLLSLGYLSNTETCSKKGLFVADHQDDILINENHQHSLSSTNNLQTTRLSPWSIYQQSLPAGIGKESLQMKDSYSGKVIVELQNAAEKKGFSQASANITAVPNTSQKRTTPVPAPVVGWPPIRSFRKNLASKSDSKLPAESQAINQALTKIDRKKQTESCQKGFFVKINMDGVPIGRKVDLKAYDSYEKLSSAVDHLFKGLLAAQIDPSTNTIQNKQKGEKGITGLLDGSGEYTLVYEDNEGDRMLVGDVPWHMFVSTVRRLRVLKSSELTSLLVGCKQEKEPN